MTAFPTPGELRMLERETLRRVLHLGVFGKVPNLREAASAAEAKINEKRGAVDVNLGFTLDIRIPSEKKRKLARRRVDVGALMEPSDDDKTVKNVSYSLVICRYDKPSSSPIVRKLHFDYQPEQYRNAGEPKPSAHMQICGKLSSHHVQAGYNAVRLNSMYPRWEKPRIPTLPTSLALLLNWLFLEFRSDTASQAIIKNPGWRSWVAYAERLVLGPYFKAANEFLASAARQNHCFVESHLYGVEEAK